MKKKITKKKIGIGITTALILGGITAGITIPLLNKVNSKEDIGNQFYQPGDEFYYLDQTGGYFTNKDDTNKVTVTALNQSNHVKQEKNISKTETISKSLISLHKVLYDEEQKGSIQLQKMYFEYNIKSLQDEKAKLTTSEADVERGKAIDQDIKEIQDKIAIIDANNIPYEDLDFSSKYPRILMKRQVIFDKKKVIIQEEKNSYVKVYDTEAEGLTEWNKYMGQKYSGATSIAQAVDSVIDAQIKTQAMARFSVKINSEYTKKMVDSTKFTFLDKAKMETLAGTDKPTEDGDNYYFLGTSSKIPSKIALTFDAHTTSADYTSFKTIASLHRLTHVQHFLIAAKQSEGKKSLPWDVNKATMKHLLQKFNGKEVLDEIKTKLFINDDATDLLIRTFSDNSEGTKTKVGSLGIKSLLSHMIGTGPLYGLGLLEAEKEIDGGTAGTNILTTLTTQLKSKATSLGIIPTGTSNDNEYNQGIEEGIDALTDAEVKAKFGSVFRDVFNAKGQFSYLIDKTNGIAVVPSSFGIHIMKLTNLTGADLESQIEKDLQSAYKEKTTSKAKLDYAQISADSFTDAQKLKVLLGDKTGANLSTDSKDTLFDDMKDYLKEKATDADLTKDQVFEKIFTAVQNNIDGEVIGKVSEALKGKIDSFTKNIDGHTRENDYDNNGVADISPELIYKWTAEMGGK